MMNMVDGEIGIDAPHQAIESLARIVDRETHEPVEHRRQLCEPLQCGLRSRKLVAVQRDGAVIIQHRHDASIEIAVLYCVRRTPLALVSQCIDCFAANVLERCDYVGADPLMGLGVEVAKMQVASIKGVWR